MPQRDEDLMRETDGPTKKTQSKNSAASLRLLGRRGGWRMSAGPEKRREADGAATALRLRLRARERTHMFA